MITTVCLACHDGTAEFPMLVCPICRASVVKAIEDIAAWYEDMLLPPARPSSGMPGAKVRDQPSPLADRVSETRTLIKVALVAWARIHVDLFAAPGSRRVAPSQVDSCSTHLVRWVDDLLSVPELAAEFCDKFQRLAHIAQRTAAPGRREGVVIALHVEGDCDQGSVWAKDLRTGKCAGCGRKESVQWWYENYPPAGEEVLTDEEAANYVSVTYGRRVSATTIRSWRFRGHIEPSNQPKDGRIGTQRGSLDSYLSLETSVTHTG